MFSLETHVYRSKSSPSVHRGNILRLIYWKRQVSFRPVWFQLDNDELKTACLVIT